MTYNLIDDTEKIYNKFNIVKFFVNFCLQKQIFFDKTAQKQLTKEQIATIFHPCFMSMSNEGDNYVRRNFQPLACRPEISPVRHLRRPGT